jgi:hypothetical protein
MATAEIAAIMHRAIFFIGSPLLARNPKLESQTSCCFKALYHETGEKIRALRNRRREQHCPKRHEGSTAALSAHHNVP